MIKDLLVTSGYPRSGNTYLNQALNLLYYPEFSPNRHRHTVNAIEKADKVIVPFRKPIDAIASWHRYPLRSTVIEDINFYIRFHQAVLDNLGKACLMDFDKFTVSVDYIKERVFENFGINPLHHVTDFDIKSAMISNKRELNLPRNNQEELQTAKELISNTEGFDKCLELYAQLKG